MSTKRIRFILFFILALFPIIFIISIITYESLNRFVVFPSEKYNAVGWWPNANEESSIHSLKTTSRKILFEYTLKGSPAFAGFSIELDRNFPFCDLSKFAELSVRLNAGRARHFGIIIMTFENGLTKLTNGEYGPWRYTQIRNDIKAKLDTYAIKLADMKEPEWWISQYNTEGKALENNPLKESYILQFFFDDMELAGQRNTIEVEEIAFHSSTDAIWITLTIGSIFYYLVFVGVFFVLPRLRKTKDNREKLLSAYRRIEYTSDKERDSQIVRSYLMEQFTNPDISLEIVSGETGISKKRIRDIVFGEFSMSFQECIGRLRINEAKRLLAETEMSIIDIAFSLGFNSNAYFASNFRSREGLTPTEYREKRGHAK
jgi:AraC-like DNA-binding protein